MQAVETRVALPPITEIPVDKIDPADAQTRRHYDPEALADLVHGIETHGLFSAILVTAGGKGRYKLVAGERRWRAHKLLKRDVIEARVVAPDVTQEDIDLMTGEENLLRAELNDVEKGEYYELMNKRHGMTIDAMAARFKVSTATISTRIAILILPDEVLEMIRTGQLNVSAAYEKLVKPIRRGALDGDDEQAVIAAAKHLFAIRSGSLGALVADAEKAKPLSGTSPGAGRRGGVTPEGKTAPRARRGVKQQLRVLFQAMRRLDLSMASLTALLGADEEEVQRCLRTELTVEQCHQARRRVAHQGKTLLRIAELIPGSYEISRHDHGSKAASMPAPVTATATTQACAITFSEALRLLPFVFPSVGTIADTRLDSKYLARAANMSSEEAKEKVPELFVLIGLYWNLRMVGAATSELERFATAVCNLRSRWDDGTFPGLVEHLMTLARRRSHDIDISSALGGAEESA